MPRRPEVAGYDLGLYGLVFGLFLVAIVSAREVDLRLVSNALGVVAFTLLVWRLVSTWDRLTVLEHALGILLALSPLVAAIASVTLILLTHNALPDNPWVFVVLLHRLGCIVLAIWWTRWLGRRHSPFTPDPA